MLVLTLLRESNMYGYEMIKKLTEKGKKQLKDKKEEWQKFSNGINHVLGGVSFAN